MKYFTLEVAKLKRTGILEILPSAGIVGAMYAFLNFIIRKDILLAMPVSPMTVLLTQVFAMLIVLNMLSLVVICALIYNIEFQENAIRKLYVLPFNNSLIYKNKLFLLFMLFLICIFLQNIALVIIGQIYLPKGSFDLLVLVKFAAYNFVTSLPVLTFMLMISSQLENIWWTLGIGILGFFSAMVMSDNHFLVFLINPFVVMLKPALVASLQVDKTIFLAAIFESILFFLTALYLIKTKHYE